MDFLDDAVVKVKDFFDVACKKTDEMVTTSKQKFDIASIEGKRAKLYQILGKKYYNELKNTEIEDVKIKSLVDEIKSMTQKIDALRESVNSTKNKRSCPSCGAAVDKLSVYCNICGERLEK